MVKKLRLDEILLQRGLVKAKKDAFILVTEGGSFVNGQKAVSPAQKVSVDAKIEVRQKPRYVGRGGYKLEAALKQFGIEVGGKVCADIGAATGGFTEVLLERGAKRVYAIDTVRGKLALKLREDPRVTVMEGIDIRDIRVLPEPAEFVTIDVSLLPLREILSHVRRLMRPEGEIVALFKPQYETRDPKILRHGVVKDTAAREKLVEEFVEWSDENYWHIINKIQSPIRGSKGNIEYLFYLNLQ